jgi:hypothetical protein
MALEGILALSTVIRLIGVYVAYHIIRALYNISPFHPLSHIPGPKLAAATWFYEAWFDLILGGMYTNEIKRMHEIYGTNNANPSTAPCPRSAKLKLELKPSITSPGPVVRINPEELHFNDIAFVDEIYAGKGRKRDKQLHFLEFVAGPIRLSAFSTAGHDLHRIRRNAVNKFFSRASIARLESLIKKLANELCDKIIRLGMLCLCWAFSRTVVVGASFRLIEASETNTGKPFDITEAYSCFTADVISSYCFGESFGFLKQVRLNETYNPEKEPQKR